MMNITLLTVGKLKEKFYIEAAAEYQKRLSPFCRFELVELPEERLHLGFAAWGDGEDFFTVTVELVVSPPFWGWLFGLGDGVEVLYPQWAAQEFRQRLEVLLRQYQRRES